MTKRKKINKEEERCKATPKMTVNGNRERQKTGSNWRTKQRKFASKPRIRDRNKKQQERLHKQRHFLPNLINFGRFTKEERRDKIRKSLKSSVPKNQAEDS